MKREKIYIFYGSISDWTGSLRLGRGKGQGVCGKALLIQGLCQLGRGDFFPGGLDFEKLEAMLERGPWGKPFFKENRELCFNISHSGNYAACAISGIPCGLDIQEERTFRSGRLLEKTMTEEERERILKAPEPGREFSRLWAYKESCLKLTGEGITRSMKELPRPEWFEEFQIGRGILGCVSAGKPCKAVYEELLWERRCEKAGGFLKSFE